ncbi:MAG: hypothetical protein MJ104_02080 [Lachnospiraceae bacterium]|nr:hypothetical protein [Lachnospiraceae bacterium]
MKALKIIFYVIAGLILSLCLFVLVCALNPPLSQKVSVFLYGDEERPGITQIFTPEGFKEYFNLKLPFNLPFGIGKNDSDIEINEPGNIADWPDYTISTLPDGVGMLTGYLPIESTEQQISDDDANELKNDLGTGDTGEALDFDTVIYPYYAMLDDSEAALYKQIYANANAIRRSFVPVTGISTTGIKRAFEAVVNDHPELFFLETAYSIKYDKSGNVAEMTLSYYTIVNDLASARDKFNSAANSIVAGAQELDSDYDREKYVHDALIGTVLYDDTVSMSQSAYSALVNGKTVCAGYARANQYILQKLGIPCYYCVGYSGQNHAWNIVMLSDGYYNEDVTWDDTVPPTYNYFNCTDTDFASSHVRTGMSVNLPPCNAFTFRGLESGAVAEVTIPEGTTVDGEEVHFKPLRYEDYLNDHDPHNTDAAHALILQELAEIGLKETDVCWSMDEYYDKCKTEFAAVGAGEQSFYVIVPESLYGEVEQAYATDEYKAGYSDDVLAKLGMNRMLLRIQAQRLGNGYYKLYHNVLTWKE